jgi:hypothetical protein
MKQIMFIAIFFTTISCSYAFSAGQDSVRCVRNYDTNGLQIHYALIGDKKFFDEWQKPQMPKIVPIDTFKRGEDIFPIIIFSTNAKDSLGNADLSYDITIIKPDGSVYGHFEQLTVWKNAPAPVMHLIQQPIDIHIEKNDPLGYYKVQSTVYDNNKRVKVHFDLSFRVIE